MFKALQCETRQKILEIIASDDGGVSSGEISEKLSISQSIALRHLEELERAGLLKSKRYQPHIGRPGTKFELNEDDCADFEIERIGKLRISLNIVEGRE